MKKLLLITILLFACINARAISSKSNTPFALKENLLFVATMDGQQAIPSVVTSAKGIGSFMLNKARNSISINISFAMLSGAPVNVSIYEGAEGTNGTLLLNLTANVANNRIATTIEGTNVTANLAKYFNDNLYVLVKTENNPMGEIRGQIKLETDLNFVADLNGMETIPMIMVSGAYGLGSFGMPLDKSQIDFKIICQGLTGAITSAKLFVGTEGMVGEQVADLSTFIDGNVITGNIIPSASMINSLLLGEIYLNITTAANPSGELRSQLVSYKGLNFGGNPSGDQMVPPVATTGQAVCVIRFSPDFSIMYYDIVVDGIPSSIDYSHLHIANFGQPYDSSSVQVDFTSSINGNRIKGTKTNVSTLNKDRLLTSKLALLIHTAEYPQGEIRTQVERYAREGFTVNLQGQQVIPAVTSAAYGSGIVSISRDGQNAHYNWIAANLSATATDSHFKNNVTGQNGPVIYHMGSAMAVDGNNATANGFWKSSDITPFLPVHSSQFSADSVYLDVQNSAFPQGEIRGQILDDYVTYTLSTKPFSSNFDFLIYPNPSSGTITISIPQPVNSKAKIEVFDLLGRIAFTKEYSGIGSSGEEIDLRTLSQGNYIVRVSHDNQFATKKITLN